MSQLNSAVNYTEGAGVYSVIDTPNIVDIPKHTPITSNTKIDYNTETTMSTTNNGATLLRIFFKIQSNLSVSQSDIDYITNSLNMIMPKLSLLSASAPSSKIIKKISQSEEVNELTRTVHIIEELRFNSALRSLNNDIETCLQKYAYNNFGYIC